MAESGPSAVKQSGRKKKKKKGTGIYMKNLLTRRITLLFSVMGSNITENIYSALSRTVEGHCEKEGYIRPGSVRIVSYSAGCIHAEFVDFMVVFECLVCRPVEGMRFQVVIKNITKAGVRAETKVSPSPVVVFIARDHHFISEGFATLKVADMINIRVIGIRYELNAPYIAVIAAFVPLRKKRSRAKRSVRIVIEEK